MCALVATLICIRVSRPKIKDFSPIEWGASERGQCVAGAGRLCVRSRDAAAALAPSMAALLRDAAAPLCARLNSLLALTDICTRYIFYHFI